MDLQILPHSINDFVTFASSYIFSKRILMAFSFSGLSGIPASKFYSSVPATFKTSIISVADDLLYKVEGALRYPKRGKQTVTIKAPIHFSDRQFFHNNILSKVLQASTYHHACWHKLVVSPHGDVNVVADADSVRCTVRRRLVRARYTPGKDGLVPHKPPRGYEVVVKLKRQRQVGGDE